MRALCCRTRYLAPLARTVAKADEAPQGNACISGSQRHARYVTHASDQEAQSLAALGWSAFFDDQLAPEEASLERMRVATVHRARLSAESACGPVRLNLPVHASTADYAVGTGFWWNPTRGRPCVG